MTRRPSELQLGVELHAEARPVVVELGGSACDTEADRDGKGSTNISASIVHGDYLAARRSIYGNGWPLVGSQ